MENMISKEKILEGLGDLRPGEGIGYRNMETGLKVLLGMTKAGLLAKYPKMKPFQTTDSVSAIEIHKNIKPNMSWPLFESDLEAF